MPLSLDGLAVPETSEEATAAIRWCVQNIGRGFHPDIRGGDYITGFLSDSDDYSHTFTDEDAQRFDEVIDAVFALLDDPYAVTLDVLNDGGTS